MFSNYQKSREIYKNKKAFTLVEVLVSVGIFSIVMLIATGSVFTIVAANKKTHSLKSVMTNLNFALENMAREIRVGTQYSCIDSGGNVVSSDPAQYRGDCNSGNVGVRFVSNRNLDVVPGNDTLEYTFSGGRIYQQRYGTDISPRAITASEISISSMKFYVIGSNASDGKQPRVLITITGSVGVGEIRSSFKIQTTVSQRSLDS